MDIYGSKTRLNWICRLHRRDYALCSAIMFEKIKVQLPAAGEKVAHLRRFL